MAVIFLHTLSESHNAIGGNTLVGISLGISLQSIEEPQLYMIDNMLAMGINIALDLLFICVFVWGIFGAALAVIRFALLIIKPEFPYGPSSAQTNFQSSFLRYNFSTVNYSNFPHHLVSDFASKFIKDFQLGKLLFQY